MVVVLLISVLLVGGVADAARIKDIARIEGDRENLLVGYGVVVGLDGTGDKTQTKFTVQSLANMLKRMGVTVDPDKVKVKNVAAVIVTASLPPYHHTGDRIDVTVSSIGDASSLGGGTLLLTPLQGPDGGNYAVAQGAVLTGGFEVGSGGGSAGKGHLTAARIPNGAIVERQIPYEFPGARRHFRLNLDVPDATTASRLASAIQRRFGDESAEALDPATIAVLPPSSFPGSPMEFIAQLEEIQVKTDAPARVVLNERTGTVVIGHNVRISQVAVAQGNLTVRIDTDFQVSQPRRFAEGDTVVVPSTQLEADEGTGHLYVLEQSVTVADLVDALNSLGASPRDIISVFQALGKAGALDARIEVM